MWGRRRGGAPGWDQAREVRRLWDIAITGRRWLMTSAPRFHLSSDEDTGLDSAEAMRVVAGPVEIRPVDGIAPRFAMSGIVLPAVVVASQQWTPITLTKGMLVDADDVTLWLSEPDGGRLGLASAEGEESVGDGDAFVRTEDRELRATLPESTRWHVVRISRAALDPLLDRRRPLTAARIPHASPSVALLRHYVNGLLCDGKVEVVGLESVVANHIRDLAALVIGASRDGCHVALAGGVMAERLQAAKRLVAKNLHVPDLCDETVAAALRISPSYIRKLFVVDGGFYAFLTRERLAHAYRLLTSPTHMRLKIIDIAYMCGFTSLSTFNRQFNSHYGAAPSDVRSPVGGGTERRLRSALSGDR